MKVLFLQIVDGKIEGTLRLDGEGTIPITTCARCGDASNCKEIDGAQVCYDCATPAEVAAVNASVDCNCPKCSATKVLN